MDNKLLNAYIAQQIRDKRKELGVTQDDIANALGLHRVSVVNMEMERQQIKAAHLFALAGIFQCQISDFFPDTEKMEISEELVEVVVLKKVKRFISKQP
ncbi:helix-turn-helix domain-containing protein [Dyadobacter sp. LHD-138]|uniref:helix-turn-helix domain-containing protein n=1 Tax=Dyadobacter sp. LHD-138 TaxID=3071413 RepID=UPI0027E0FAC4|nr:helix-turn-helix domain-containing protein [Dyadobacter sp. LHD-138]MDQ6477812.1 helix-turn-helix domain-containing protein [Dyadobacter sp. LHD-138]